MYKSSHYKLNYYYYIDYVYIFCLLCEILYL